MLRIEGPEPLIVFLILLMIYGFGVFVFWVIEGLEILIKYLEKK